MADAASPKVGGLILTPSAYGVAATLDRLEAALLKAGVVVFTRIDHGAGAAKANLPLRPTQVLIFGNPQAGTALMQSRQTVGIDLPLKAMAFEDEMGRTWVGYDDPGYLAKRHGIADRDAAINAMRTALEGWIKSATTSAPVP